MKDLKYKLVVSDFDGTLTPSYYEMVDETTEAVKRWRAAGGKFALCTGRPISDTSKALGDGGLECDAVCYSQGAIVHVNGKAILDAGLDKKLAYEIISMVESKWKRKYLVYVDDKMYYTPNTPDVTTHVKFFVEHGGNGILVDNVLDCVRTVEGSMTKFVIIKGASEDVSEITKFILDNFGDKVIVNSGNPWFLEVISNKYTKGTATRLIAEALGVSEEETITIGDSTNDIEMVKFGFGMAVASGSEAVKKVAKYIAPPVTEKPVKFVIDKLLNGEEF
jgi:Cof subfamily protein (haloacid dehalogenase superfamily)